MEFKILKYLYFIILRHNSQVWKKTVVRVSPVCFVVMIEIDTDIKILMHTVLLCEVTCFT